MGTRNDSVPMGGTLRGLTDSNDDKSSHSIQDAQVLNSKHNMVEEEGHQAAESNASNPKKRQEHCKEERKEVGDALFDTQTKR